MVAVEIVAGKDLEPDRPLTVGHPRLPWDQRQIALPPAPWGRHDVVEHGAESLDWPENVVGRELGRPAALDDAGIGVRSDHGQPANDGRIERQHGRPIG